MKKQVEREKRISGRKNTDPGIVQASLAAVTNDEVIGFLFGHYEELEFGLPGSIAWVDIIGVDPGYRLLGLLRS